MANLYDLFPLPRKEKFFPPPPKGKSPRKENFSSYLLSDSPKPLRSLPGVSGTVDLTFFPILSLGF